MSSGEDLAGFARGVRTDGVVQQPGNVEAEVDLDERGHLRPLPAGLRVQIVVEHPKRQTARAGFEWMTPLHPAEQRVGSARRGPAQYAAGDVIHDPVRERGLPSVGPDGAASHPDRGRFAMQTRGLWDAFGGCG